MLVGAWVAVAAGATGRIADLMPGGCADGIGCIFSVGIITSVLALPFALIFGSFAIASDSAYRAKDATARRPHWRTVGAIGAMVASLVILAAAWFYPTGLATSA